MSGPPFHSSKTDQKASVLEFELCVEKIRNIRYVLLIAEPPPARYTKPGREEAPWLFENLSTTTRRASRKSEEIFPLFSADNPSEKSQIRKTRASDGQIKSRGIPAGRRM